MLDINLIYNIYHYIVLIYKNDSKTFKKINILLKNKYI